MSYREGPNQVLVSGRVAFLRLSYYPLVKDVEGLRCLWCFKRRVLERRSKESRGMGAEGSRSRCSRRNDEA